MGRPRKTIAEMKLSGTFSKNSYHKTWNTETPCQMNYTPAPSHYLSKTKRAWDSFMIAKTAQRILSNEDEALVLMMFDALDGYHRATEKLIPLLKQKELKEDIVELDRLSKIQKRFMDSFVTIAVKFGISPIERSKLTIPPTPRKEESPIMKLMRETMEMQKQYQA